MSFTVDETVAVTGGSLLRACSSDHEIHTLVTDSRRIYNSRHAVFIAIAGERHNGHQYIPSLVESGVKHFLVEQDIDIPEGADISVIRVKSSMDALHAMAIAHRRKFSIPVIGITGSNGKTIVKEWLYQVLDPHLRVVRSPKSYNSQLGVPLSVWQMGAHDQAGIFEAGISRPGEMEKLEKIIKPGIGIFTNIGDAHSEGFTDQEEKIAEKMKLFSHCKVLIYCKDQPETAAAVKQEGLSWGQHPDADMRITSREVKAGKTEVQVKYQGREMYVTIPFTDRASVENAMHVWLAASYLGIGQDDIRTGMLKLQPVEMRLQLKEGINNCDLVNDSYSTDINSLLIALDFLEAQSKHRRKTLILSDFMDTAYDREKLYSEVALAMQGRDIARIIGIGQELTRHQHLFRLPEKIFYTDTKEFLEHFSPADFRDEAVLLKGARVFGFESIGKRLERRAHETVLEINLNAVVQNLNHFRARLKPGVRLMGMVKAYSYGSGSYEIAKLMQFHRVDYLGVAYPDEGISLRKAGITMPVMIMNTDAYAMDLLPEFGLEPVIYNFDALEAFMRVCERDHISGAGFHIEVDTGMHRLGFEEGDAARLASLVKGNERIRLQSVFSHLSASDEAQHDGFTREQVNRFSRFCTELEDLSGKKFLRHILNSAGILRFPDAQFDMVRLGIGLYGIDPSDKQQLENVLTLKTHISQIRHVDAGESVGYSRKAVSDSARTIGVLAIGYADGLSRALSNGKGRVWVNGKLAPVTGNICMDMTMVDLTGIDARVGDEVIIFGKELPIQQVAASLGTIAYEVLTGISQRVKRVYYYE